MVAEYDDMVGAYVSAPKEAGLEESTVLILTSDHGDMKMQHQQLYKMVAYEASSRVPCVIAGPGITPRGNVLTLASLVDVMPTLLELGKVPLDGHLDQQDVPFPAQSLGQDTLSQPVRLRHVCGQHPRAAARFARVNRGSLPAAIQHCPRQRPALKLKAGIIPIAAEIAVLPLADVLGRAQPRLPRRVGVHGAQQTKVAAGVKPHHGADQRRLCGVEYVARLQARVGASQGRTARA